MVANIFNQLDLTLAFMLPIIYVVDGILLLEPFQQRLVLLSYPLSILVTNGNIERPSNGLSSAAANGLVAALPPGIFFQLVGRNGRHVAFLVLWEVLAWSCQDAGHAFQ